MDDLKIRPKMPFGGPQRAYFAQSFNSMFNAKGANLLDTQKAGCEPLRCLFG